jgi:hypothetical protein
MQGTRFTVSYHTAGTLAANHSFIFKLPFACQLIGVSAAASNASSAILDIGYTGALEAYVANMDVGDSSVAAIYQENTDFEGDEFPHIAAETNIICTLDYDGAGGTAAADFTLVLTFTEG